MWTRHHIVTPSPETVQRIQELIVRFGSTYTNDLFRLRPYAPPACTCDRDTQEQKWLDAHPHKTYCARRSAGYECTCGRNTEFSLWSEPLFHAEECLVVRPNFWYQSTDFALWWYRYPVKDGWSNQCLTEREWRHMLIQCANRQNA